MQGRIYRHAYPPHWQGLVPSSGGSTYFWKHDDSTAYLHAPRINEDVGSLLAVAHLRVVN